MNGNPIEGDDKKETEKTESVEKEESSEREEPAEKSSKNDGPPRPYTEEEMRELAKEHPYRIRALLPAQLLILVQTVMVDGKEEMLPHQLLVQNVGTGEAYVVVGDLQRIELEESCGAAIQCFIKDMESRRKILAPSGAFPRGI